VELVVWGWMWKRVVEWLERFEGAEVFVLDSVGLFLYAGMPR